MYQLVNIPINPTMNNSMYGNNNTDSFITNGQLYLNNIINNNINNHSNDNSIKYIQSQVAQQQPASIYLNPNHLQQLSIPNNDIYIIAIPRNTNNANNAKTIGSYSSLNQKYTVTGNVDTRYNTTMCTIPVNNVSHINNNMIDYVSNQTRNNTQKVHLTQPRSVAVTNWTNAWKDNRIQCATQTHSLRPLLSPINSYNTDGIMSSDSCSNDTSITNLNTFSHNHHQINLNNQNLNKDRNKNAFKEECHSSSESSASSFISPFGTLKSNDDNQLQVDHSNSNTNNTKQYNHQHNNHEHGKKSKATVTRDTNILLSNSNVNKNKSTEQSDICINEQNPDAAKTSQGVKNGFPCQICGRCMSPSISKLHFCPEP